MAGRIYAKSIDLSTAATIISGEDIVLVIGDDTISVKELMNEVSLLKTKVKNLEDIYMEEKLLGASDGNSTN